MVIWLIGLSGAGKTSLAKDVVDIIHEQKESVVLVDGDDRTRGGRIGHGFL